MIQKKTLLILLHLQSDVGFVTDIATFHGYKPQYEILIFISLICTYEDWTTATKSMLNNSKQGPFLT